MLEEFDIKNKTKKTSRRWTTWNCPVCHAPWDRGCSKCGGTHENYIGKIDDNCNEYVICGCTGDKVIVMLKTGEMSLYWRLL